MQFVSFFFMKVLFVDDDPDDVALFCEAVEYLTEGELIQQNCDPVEFQAVDDGQEALRFLADVERLPDLIFLDINMPVMDGKTCLSALKKDRRLAEIPVIMFSTAYRDNDETYFEAQGVQECLRKPNGFKDLVKLLGRVLYKRMI